MSIIEEIMGNGQKLNDTINEKIKLLGERNQQFNQTLTDKLKEIIGAIEKFKNTNLQGLTETKDKLAAVTKELQDTKEELEKTKIELDRVTTELVNLQTQIQQTNTEKDNLQKQIMELDGKIQKMEMEYENKINAAIQYESQKSTEAKKQMQQEFDANIAAIEQQKKDLEKRVEEAEKNQNNAINNLSILQKEHDELTSKLVDVNDMLGNHIKQIETINTNQPEYREYEALLDTIHNGLSGVISGIKNAVSSTSVTNSASQIPYNFNDNFIKLEKLSNLMGRPNLKKFLKEKIPNISDSVVEALANVSVPGNEKPIKDILLSRKIIIPDFDINQDGQKGGRRKRRTMKKRPKKTRKLMKKKQKGGYVYSASKELDKASSVISHSSGKSKGRSSTSLKRKRKRRTKKI
jgi:ABC-type transporter Mla subunit MlaD